MGFRVDVLALGLVRSPKELPHVVLAESHMRSSKLQHYCRQLSSEKHSEPSRFLIELWDWVGNL